MPDSVVNNSDVPEVEDAEYHFTDDLAYDGTDHEAEVTPKLVEMGQRLPGSFKSSKLLLISFSVVALVVIVAVIWMVYFNNLNDDLIVSNNKLSQSNNHAAVLNNTRSAVNNLPGSAMNRIPGSVVNSGSESAVSKVSDAAVNKVAESAVNNVSESAVNNVPGSAVDNIPAANNSDASKSFDLNNASNASQDLQATKAVLPPVAPQDLNQNKLNNADVANPVAEVAPQNPNNFNQANQYITNSSQYASKIDYNNTQSVTNNNENNENNVIDANKRAPSLAPTLAASTNNVMNNAYAATATITETNQRITSPSISPSMQVRQSSLPLVDTKAGILSDQDRALLTKIADLAEREHNNNASIFNDMQRRFNDVESNTKLLSVQLEAVLARFAALQAQNDQLRTLYGSPSSHGSANQDANKVVTVSSEHYPPAPDNHDLDTSVTNSKLQELNTDAPVHDNHLAHPNIITVSKVVNAKTKVSYYIQAIIPGRAWLRSSSGDTITVARGDSIPGVGKVSKIDPYNGGIHIATGKQTVLLVYASNEVNNN